MGRPKKPDGELDCDLEDLPPQARWREWKGRVEAVIFASAQPVTRAMLAQVVGKTCSLDALIDDIRAELRGRPYELVSVAGGWSFRTKLGFGAAIKTALGGPQRAELSKGRCQVNFCWAQLGCARLLSGLGGRDGFPLRHRLQAMKVGGEG